MIRLEDQKKFINQEVRAWVKEDVEPALAKAIRRRKKKIPGETETNLRHEFMRALSDTVGYQLRFQDSGRHVDMRVISHRKRPISREKNFILEWVKKKGRGAFRYDVPGYRDVYGPYRISEEKQLQRIASAIIASKRGKEYRPKGQWYAKTIWRLVGRLTSRLTRNQAEFFIEYNKQELAKALTSEGAFRQRVN